MFYLVDTRDGFCECIDTDDSYTNRLCKEFRYII